MVESKGDINLSMAAIDVMPMVSSGANGLIVLQSDSPALNTGSRVINSHIFKPWVFDHR